MDVPMLEEHEWEQVHIELINNIKEIKAYRERTGAGLPKALEAVRGTKALAKYFDITGFAEANVNALWHHRLSQFGPLCSVCEKPLRTPNAKYCAACGADR
jgi:hypothetical protein